MVREAGLGSILTPCQTLHDSFKLSKQQYNKELSSFSICFHILSSILFSHAARSVLISLRVSVIHS